MPNAVVKSYAKQTGKSTDTVEKNWDKGKDAAKDAGLKPGSDEFYAYTNAVTKKMSGVQEDEDKEKKGSVYTPFFQTQGFVEGFFDNLKKKLALVQHDVNELKIELKVQKNRTYKAKQEVEAKKVELKKQMNDLLKDKSIPFEMKDELFSSLERMLNDLNKLKEDMHSGSIDENDLKEVTDDLKQWAKGIVTVKRAEVISLSSALPIVKKFFEKSQGWKKIDVSPEDKNIIFIDMIGADKASYQLYFAARTDASFGELLSPAGREYAAFVITKDKKEIALGAEWGKLGDVTRELRSLINKEEGMNENVKFRYKRFFK